MPTNRRNFLKSALAAIAAAGVPFKMSPSEQDPVIEEPEDDYSEGDRYFGYFSDFRGYSVHDDKKPPIG